MSAPLLIMVSGITNPDDARVAVDAGADLLSFDFRPKSLRFVQMHVVNDILSELGPRLKGSVAVFCDEKDFMIRKVLADSGCTQLEFTGKEPADFREQFEKPYFRRVGVASEDDVAAALRDPAERFIVDLRYVFELQRAAKIASIADVMVGGLISEDNAEMVVRQVSPIGIEIGELIEEKPGRKDQERMTAFIKLIRLIPLSDDGIGITQ